MLFTLRPVDDPPSLIFNNTVINFVESHIGHNELITNPIDSSGDPHGLWQFIVHLTMNVVHHNMP